MLQSYPHQEENPEFVLPDFLNQDRMPPGRPRDEVRKTSTFIITQKAGKADEFTSGAIAYRDLSKRQELVGTLSLKCEKDFQTESALREFLRKHPAVEATYVGYGETYQLECRLPIQIQQQFFRYWSSNIVRSEVNLYLQNAAELMISAGVRIDRQTSTASTATIVFVCSTQPQIRVGIEEALNQLRGEPQLAGGPHILWAGGPVDRSH